MKNQKTLSELIKSDARRALVEAAMYGKVALAKRAIANGASLNRTFRGRTPLHWACQEGHLSVVRCLIRAGADIDKADDHGHTPLRQAVGEGHAQIVKALISAGVELDRRDDTDCTALHLACAYGQKKCVELLLKAGATHDLKDDSGLTPRYYAAIYGHKDVEDAANYAQKESDGSGSANTSFRLEHLKNRSRHVPYLATSTHTRCCGSRK